PSLRGAKRRSNPSIPALRYGLLRGAYHPAALRADRVARNDGRYCLALIAQDTLTVTESVSSPCATGAPAAIGAAILPRYNGTGAPSSEMLIGSPSVTPAALAWISALRRASAIAFSRASSRCFEACETVKLMPPMSVAPAP